MSAPGLGNHPSPSTEKIDHLLSVQTESPTSVQLDRPPEPRYSYDLKAASVSSRAANTPQWRPLHLRISFILANVIVLLALALVVELLYFLNSAARGWEPSPWLLDHSAFVPYFAVLPGLLGWFLIHPWMEVDCLVKVVQPYVNMSKTRTLAGTSVLLNYTDRRGLFQLPKIIRNKHLTPLLSTGICILAVLVTPFAAGYIRLAPVRDGPFTPVTRVKQMQQLAAPTGLPFSKLNAAAGYANAAASFSVNPPASFVFNGNLAWSAAEIDHHQSGDGIVSANTLILASHADCQYVADISYSKGIITGVAYGWSLHINTTDSTNTAYYTTVETPSAFGVSLVVANDSFLGSVSPVVFWEVYNTGSDTIVLATTCQPKVVAYRGDAFLNATNGMMLGFDNLGPLREPDLLGLNLTGTVTNGQVTGWANPLNSTALNGLFLNWSTDADNRILRAVRSSLAYAVDMHFRNYLRTGFGFGYLGAHLDAALMAYGNYLGAIAPSLYFQPLKSPKGLGQPTAGSFRPFNQQRLIISASIAHTLFIMLVLMAAMGLAVAQYHRQDSKCYKLHAAPGSIAQAVAVAATSDLPTLLRPTDTAKDIKSVLQEYTFTLNRETGGLVLGDRDPATIPDSPTHIPMTGVSSWMKKLHRDTNPSASA